MTQDTMNKYNIKSMQPRYQPISSKYKVLKSKILCFGSKLAWKNSGWIKNEEKIHIMNVKICKTEMTISEIILNPLDQEMQYLVFDD